MAAKLESILRQIPWFLILKAAALGASFYFLPFWLFLIIGGYFYFSHLFGSFRFFAPFLLALGLAYFSGPSFWLAFFLAIVFFLILGIKELVFIDRASAYEVLVYLLILLLSWDFFSHFLSWQLSTVLWAITAAVFLFLILRVLIGQFAKEDQGRQKEFLFVAIVSFLIWQLNLILLLLPLNYFYQTALSLLVAAIFIDFLVSYFKSDLTRRRILVNFSFFFILIVIILASVQWRI